MRAVLKTMVKSPKSYLADYMVVCSISDRKYKWMWMGGYRMAISRMGNKYHMWSDIGVKRA